MQRRAYILLTLTALIWGANAVAGKLAVGHVSPLLLTLFRWLFALLAVLPFAWPHIRRDLPVIRENLTYLMLLGGAGFTGFNATLYLALNYTSTINAVIEQAGMPLIIFAANFILLRIAVSSLQIIGFALTLVGVAVTVSGGDFNALLALQLNRGDALMLVAIVFYGGYTVALRWKPPIHWLSLMAVLCLGAALGALPLAIAEAATDSMITPDATGWAIILFTAILPSLVAQALYIRGNEIIGANRAGLFVNLVPIFGTVLAVAVVGEQLYPFHLVGLGLVLGGIAIAEKGKPKVA
ncbi:DMT family transporter [Georhizobium profundi]|uniref:DMT family transporter n=1 Tax=Georhizobium profundi TaxID=2341112 RepID=A0A3Q8XSP7_9HYPH|nr:DMT family transporter [Georhizobium profundi]AZN73126.1 DMT family transporter [Georhizobium profundi]GLQ38141.1 membrane protein [Rhizobium albus]